MTKIEPPNDFRIVFLMDNAASATHFENLPSIHFEIQQCRSIYEFHVWVILSVNFTIHFLVFVTDHLRLLDVGLRTGVQETVSQFSGVAKGDTGRFVAAGLTQWQQAFRIAIPIIKRYLRIHLF